MNNKKLILTYQIREVLSTNQKNRTWSKQARISLSLRACAVEQTPTTVWRLRGAQLTLYWWCMEALYYSFIIIFSI